jgi:hypothetical protein
VDWWGWLIVALAVLILAGFSALLVQARRRSGGVIAAKGRPHSKKGGAG